MSGWSPAAWLRPLPEWTPDELPGYAEAKAKADRGEPLFPARVKGTPRARRTVESLRVERDALLTRRNRLGVTRNDRAAAMLSHGVARRESARLDRELVKFARLTKRIEALEFRIAGARA